MAILDFSTIHPDWTNSIPRLGTSQKGQDTTLEYVFDNIKTTNKYYVEFGAIDGYQDCNTCYFREHEGWKGLLLESGQWGLGGENLDINLHMATITKDNICEIFKTHNVPLEFDLLSIDIDSYDYWITEKILTEYSPRCIMVEVNVRFEPDESWVLKYDPDWHWDGLKWYGASPLAYKKILNKFGYTPVWIHVDDMIAIRTDVLKMNGFDEPDWKYVYPHSNFPLYATHTMGGTSLAITELNLNEWEQI